MFRIITRIQAKDRIIETKFWEGTYLELIPPIYKGLLELEGTGRLGVSINVLVQESDGKGVWVDFGSLSKILGT